MTPEEIKEIYPDAPESAYGDFEEMIKYTERKVDDEKSTQIDV